MSFKKVFFPIILSLLLLFTACSAADVDLRKKDLVYDGFADAINHPESYVDKTVEVTADCIHTYRFASNSVRYSLRAIHKDGEKQAFYEIRTEDGIYPEHGTQTCTKGRFCEGGYILVESFGKNVALNDGKINVNIDTLEMSAENLKDFIESFRKEYQASEHFEKSIRIFGQYEYFKEYHYLLGLDSDGAITWEIELHDPNNVIDITPKENRTINAVEVIGKLSVYTESNITYACITVEQIQSVEGSLS